MPSILDQYELRFPTNKLPPVDFPKFHIHSECEISGSPDYTEYILKLDPSTEVKIRRIFVQWDGSKNWYTLDVFDPIYITDSGRKFEVIVFEKVDGTLFALERIFGNQRDEEDKYNWLTEAEFQQKYPELVEMNKNLEDPFK